MVCKGELTVQGTETETSIQPQFKSMVNGRRIREIASPYLQDEIEDFINSVNQGKGFAQITEIISSEVQRQLENQLIEFSSAIAQSNLAAIADYGDRVCFSTNIEK